MKFNFLVKETFLTLIVLISIHKFTFAVELEEHLNLNYAGTDNTRQELDLVIPKVKNKTSLPLILFIHGGAWKGGDKRKSLPRVLPYARKGSYAVASIGYRLSSEAIWPAQIHDCKAAIRFLKANASEYNIDPNRIGIWGSSAGGHLVSMLGTSAGVEEMDGAIGEYTSTSTKIKCVVNFYGPTNFLLMDDHNLKPGTFSHNSPQSPESLLIGGPIQENKDKVQTANPISYIDSYDSPILIVHGDKDTLVPFHQSEILHAALKKEQVETTMITVKGAGHGKGFGPDVGKNVANFFDHHLLGKKVNWQDHSLTASFKKRKP